MPIPNKPVVLIILDGWGISPPSRSNAISQAKLPFYNSLIDTYPVLAIQAAGEAVGLPWGEMGNSEVGHINLGAGRIIYQNLPRISKSIADNSFYRTPTFLKAISHAKKNKSALHLLGLIGVGSVHSSTDHLFALMELCRKHALKKVFLHLILDGRDSPKDSGQTQLEKVLKKIKELKVGEIATLAGRYYSMDRDNRWEREKKVYVAMTEGRADNYATTALEAIKKSYRDKIYDEEFIPTVIGKSGKPTAVVADKDALIFFNFRPDRARQITTAFVLPGFDKFDRPSYLKNLYFVAMTQYDRDLPVDIAYPPVKIDHPMARVIAEEKLTQLHIAETEKYAHVTYFFNGGKEEPFPGQENIIVPSPKVASYNKEPAMSANKLTDRLVTEVKKGTFDFIVANFANPDMVAHTGSLKATKEAVEVVDDCLERIVTQVLKADGLVFITADHGNCEEMSNLQTGDMDKEHSVNPVPFIAIGKQWEGKPIYKDLIVDHDLSMLPTTGILSDITVTILKYMGINPASDMTGNDLLTL